MQLVGIYSLLRLQPYCVGFDRMRVCSGTKTVPAGHMQQVGKTEKKTLRTLDLWRHWIISRGIPNFVSSDWRTARGVWRSLLQGSRTDPPPPVFFVNNTRKKLRIATDVLVSYFRTILHISWKFRDTDHNGLRPVTSFSRPCHVGMATQRQYCVGKATVSWIILKRHADHVSIQCWWSRRSLAQWLMIKSFQIIDIHVRFFFTFSFLRKPDSNADGLIVFGWSRRVDWYAYWPSSVARWP